MRRLICAFICALASGTVRAQTIDTLALRAHTFFLSSDALEGRGTSTRGERLAADYIATQLQLLGAQPLGGSWFQDVPLRAARIIDSTTTLTVRSDAGATTLHSSTDFILNAGAPEAFRDFSGDALFVGTAPVAGRVAGDDVRGKVLVLAGTMGPDAYTLIPRWTSLGAAAVVLLVPDSAQYALYVQSRGVERFIVNADVDDPVWQPKLPVIIGNRNAAAAFLRGAGVTDSMLNGTTVFSALPLGRSVQASIDVSHRDAPARNVIGVIRGSRYPNEFVSYAAHYDHLGIGIPDARGDSIYNGFTDNAAGVAMLLAVGKAFVQKPPERSILLLFFTGEERGLLGSSYFAAKPVLPIERIVANITLDAGAPPAPPLTWRIAGGDASTLGTLAQSVAAAHKWTATTSAASPNTDYWPLLRRGVPAIFLIPGGDWEGVSQQQKDALQARWEHYHQPADEWRADFPFSGLQRYAQLALEIGQRAATGTERPRLTCSTTSTGSQ